MMSGRGVGGLALIVCALGCQRAVFPEDGALAPLCVPASECAPGVEVACASACGTAGVGACTIACEPPSAGECRFDCAASACRALEETCNYCDDDGDRGILDEVRLATAVRAFTPERCADVALLGASCDPATGVIRLTTGPDQARGARLGESIVLGYGPTVIEAAVEVRRGSDCPAHGWAIVVTDEHGLDTLSSDAAALGIDPRWRGFAGEWRFYPNEVPGTCATAEESDHLHLRPLTGDGVRRAVIGGGPGLAGDPPLDAGSDRWVRQSLRLTITPEIPGSGTDPMRAQLERLEPHSVAHDCSDCGVVFHPGDRVRVAVVATSGASWHESRVTLGHDGGFPTVRAHATCPDPCVDCDDGLDCTADRCTAAGCEHTPLASSCVATSACVEPGRRDPDDDCRECVATDADARWSTRDVGAACTLGGAEGRCGERGCCVGALRVAAGASHTCAVRADGSLFCWGLNDQGRLGLGDVTQRTLPTRVGTDGDWDALGLGADHTCAVRRDTSLWCWGRNDYGQLGVGDSARHVFPARVEDTGFMVVAGGLDHTCALRTDGSLYCWGRNRFGQLGLGDTTDRLRPERVGTDTGWTSLGLGDNHTCASRSDGTLHCWGRNGGGRLGVGDTIDRQRPTRVPGEDWIEVAARGFHTCAMRADGSVSCWGDNYSGQLGVGDTDPRDTPAPVAAEPGFVELRAGWAHTCARRSDGSLFCWGAAPSGGTSVPTRVDSSTIFSAVAAGGSHTCAIDADRQLSCWGRNLSGQLGVGDRGPRDSPTAVDCF